MVCIGAKLSRKKKQKAGEENMFVFSQQHHWLMMLKLYLNAHTLLIKKEAVKKKDISVSVAIRQCSWLRLINHIIIA